MSKKLIPVTVISLKRSTQRRDFMRDQLDGIGIPFKFFDAIDGRTLSENERIAAAPFGGTDYAGLLTPGEIGCALSHLKVIREIADGKEEFSAVLEDDVCLHEEAANFFDEDVLRSITPFDVIHLEAPTEKKKMMQVGEVTNAFKLYVAPRPSLGLGGIIFTRAAAQKIIQSITDITSPIDNMLFLDKRPKSFRVIEVCPSVVEQSAGLVSDIGKRQKIKSFSGKAEREFKRIRNQYRYWKDFLSAWGTSSIFRLRARN